MRTRFAWKDSGTPPSTAVTSNDNALAAILENDVSESPSSVHACMPFEDVCRTDRRHDVIWRQVFEDAIRRAKALRGLLRARSASRPTGIAARNSDIRDGGTRERTRRRDPVAGHDARDSATANSTIAASATILEPEARDEPSLMAVSWILVRNCVMNSGLGSEVACALKGPSHAIGNERRSARIARHTGHVSR